MKVNNSFFYFLLLTVIIGVIFLTLNNTEKVENYKETIIRKREEKNNSFRLNSDSPFSNNTEFKTLNYFEPDENYIVNASLELISPPQKTTIIQTDGSSGAYNKFAYATFKLKDRSFKVVLLQPEETEESDPNYLFFPFTDNTCGKDTYGAGRYIDLNYQDKLNIRIDFNYAYNPYCAYNSNYLCPIPPLENHLDIDIQAGEKKYQKEDSH